MPANAEVIQVGPRASGPDVSLRTDLNLGRLHGPLDTRSFNQILPSPWNARLLPHTSSSSSLVQLRQASPTTAAFAEPLSSASPAQLGTAPGRAGQRSDVHTRVGPHARATTVTMDIHGWCRHRACRPLHLLLPTWNTRSPAFVWLSASRPSHLPGEAFLPLLPSIFTTRFISLKEIKPAPHSRVTDLLPDD